MPRDGSPPGGSPPEIPLLPGVSMLGRGIYVKPRKPYELKDVIFEGGEFKGEKTKGEPYASREGGQAYLVPENCVVNDSPPAPADQSLGETVIEESWDRFGYELTSNASAALRSNLISIDPTAFQGTNLRSEEDSYYALRNSFIALWNVSMINAPSVPALEQKVAALPHDPRDPTYRAGYAAVFEKFGSHYVKSAWVGGKASLVFVVAKSSQLTKDEVRANIQMSLGVLGGSSSTEQKKVDERFRSASTCRVFGSGGDRILLAELSSFEGQTYGKWITSVKRNPQVIQLGLVGIWTLVEDARKAAALKAAYMNEARFQPLTAAIPLDTAVYFLKDGEVFEYKLRVQPGEIRRTDRDPRIASSFKAVLRDSKFLRPDAAIFLSGFGTSSSGESLDDKLYLFKHRECMRLNIDGETLSIDPGYPRDVERDWPGLDFDRVDAALTVAPDKVYFFRGPNYIRVDMAKGQPPVVGTRDLIKRRWAGVTFDRLDTALYWWNSKVYFFSGDQYIRYDMTLYRADPGYPRFVESNYVEDWELFE